MLLSITITVVTEPNFVVSKPELNRLSTLKRDKVHTWLLHPVPCPLSSLSASTMVEAQAPGTSFHPSLLAEYEDCISKPLMGGIYP